MPQDTAALNSGTTMPLLGFGTWQLEGRRAREAVTTALEAGYRHVDTATIYNNEADVGRAVAQFGRDQVFVTTKCHPRDAGRELSILQRSLDALRTDAVDLWLIHWPAGTGADVEMWQGFIEARDKGLARSIGVSNYALHEIDQLHTATGVAPAVNQVKWSPLLFQRSVLDGHRQRGIALEGYSGLKGGTLDHPVVMGIAQRLGRTPAQVVVRWHLQHGVVVIPRSSRPERIRANADVGDFQLGPEDMAALDGLGEP